MSVLTKGVLLVALVFPTPQHANSGCHQTYTVSAAKQATLATYSGWLSVTRKQVQHLHLLARCQRNSRAKPYVWWYERHQRARWWARLHPILSALAICIIGHESTWNPQAVNGDHEGYGQWDHYAWVEDGGPHYASTPLGAIPPQQETVLMGEGQTGMENQQAQYDGC